jgi:uncharacterized membrane protein
MKPVFWKNGLRPLLVTEQEGSAAAVTSDGKTIIGTLGRNMLKVFRWTEQDGLVILTDGPPEGYQGLKIKEVSDDGRIFVATANSLTNLTRAFRWSAPGGWERIGESGMASWAEACDGTGSIVVGWKQPSLDQAFYWDEKKGFRDLRDVLLEHGIDAKGEGWTSLVMAGGI